ncbi:protein RICE SALT SENSITIVE 3-like isoform X2 [Wolffia australiana]
MEEHLSSLAAAHLLQQALRSLCIHEEAQWVYAIFWRILPRNYPPPKWDIQAGILDRSRASRRNWILAWEDGFCNFTASSDEPTNAHDMKTLRPELFFKMSHEIYSYGEGVVGKIAADLSHKWIFKEPKDHDIGYLSGWPLPCDSYPRTWEAQFQCGIKTIALIAVGEGVLQLGSHHRVPEDLTYIALLRKRFNYLESIPGVLLPHPSSSTFPFPVNGCYGMDNSTEFNSSSGTPAPMEVYGHDSHPIRITPSMRSLQALLSKLPPVCPTQPSSVSLPSCVRACNNASTALNTSEIEGVDKGSKHELEEDDEVFDRRRNFAGQSSDSAARWFIDAARFAEGL